MEQYAVPSTGPWMIKVLEIIYWIYAAAVMFVAVFQYHVIFDREQLPVTEAMPAWILPVYPFLILGPLGSTLLKSQPPASGLPIFIGSITFAGLGWTVAFFMLTLYFTRLVNSELPEASKRPGMYVAVGPAAYTANTFVSLAMYAPKHIPENFLGITSVPDGDLFKAFGVAAGIFMWLISFWFCALTTVSVLVSAKESHFTLNYWAFIFPNAGLVITLIQIANVLDSPGIKCICSGATVILVIVWFFVAFMNVHGIFKKLVLWPGMDEDMEDMEGRGDDPSEGENFEGNGHSQVGQENGDARRRQSPTWV
jgi:tellurite resistance protein TehA-like permease